MHIQGKVGAELERLMLMLSYGWWMCLLPVILEGTLVTEMDFFLRSYSLSAAFQGKLISTPWIPIWHGIPSLGHLVPRLSNRKLWLLLKSVVEAAGKAQTLYPASWNRSYAEQKLGF